jgi:zinc/manganese transport system substrate-binding protein/manganese/iron transport system substrate-binding protein
MNKRLWLIISLLGIMVTACGSTGSVTSGNLHVVATTTIIGDIARNIAGDKANVIILLTPGVDPHEYEPVPADLQALSQAKMVFANGGGLEPWLPKTMQSAGSSIKTQMLTDGLTLRTLNEGGATIHDPHVWFDVNNTIHFAEQIRDSLIAIDPANAEVYQTNARNYIARLTDLDSAIAKQVETIPPERRLLVTNHDTFGYFAARYGFKVVGTVFPAGGAEASPSAQQVVELVNLIKASQVKAVFTENTLNPELANTIAQEAGVKVITQLYTDSLGPKDSPASTYIDMMQFDVKTIVEALK